MNTNMMKVIRPGLERLQQSLKDKKGPQTAIAKLSISREWNERKSCELLGYRLHIGRRLDTISIAISADEGFRLLSLGVPVFNTTKAKE